VSTAVPGEKRHPHSIHRTKDKRIRRPSEGRAGTDLADPLQTFHVIQTTPADDPDLSLWFSFGHG